MKSIVTKRKDLCWILLLTIMALFPNIYLAIVGYDLGDSIISKAAFLGVSFAIFFIPALFFKAKIFFLFQGIFLLLAAPIEIAHIYLNKTGITTGFLTAVFDTNFHEAKEVLASVIPFVIVILIVWFVYFFITVKKIDNSYLIPNLKFRLYISIGIILIFSCLFLYYYQMTKKALPKNEQFNVMEQTWVNFSLKFYKIYPSNFILRTKNVVIMKHRMEKQSEKLRTFSFQAKKQEEREEREIYVFVIGETARYSNFSINGYERKTSPLLEKIDDLVSFSDFYSEANITSLSLPIMLTRSTPNDYNRYFYEKSFVDAFKEAGFNTYWIANQSSGNSFIRRISKDTDGEYFTTKDFDAADNFDENLWPYVDEVLNKNEKKVLIVLHTLGSHFRYNYRYPDDYEVFKPNFQGAFNYNLISPENKELFVNTYDNSILYTDYFLSNTIKKIEAQDAVSFFVYTSDHGENLYDTAENISLHAGVKPTKYDVHVPFFVWSSPKYQEVYPQKWDNVKENKNKKISASVLFHSMLDAADITFPEKKAEKSITSGLLKEDSVRYVITSDKTVQVFE